MVSKYYNPYIADGMRLSDSALPKATQYIYGRNRIQTKDVLIPSGQSYSQSTQEVTVK